jgi:aspartyl-tRNA(Asn)/glutamyl-tRNA(Gln) amidotransferase subunit C
MAISLEQARWVAHLARLELSPGELDSITPQLNAVLDYIDQLRAIPTDDVEPMAHPLSMQNVFRADEPRPSLTVAEALANAPNRHGDFFGVPAVLE